MRCCCMENELPRLNKPAEWTKDKLDLRDRYETYAEFVDSITLSEAQEYPMVLVGEPYDRGHIGGRPGSRDGPASLRSKLSATRAYYYGVGPATQIGDLGDIDVERGKTNQTMLSQLQEVTAEVHKKDTLPVFLGGDHTLCYANVAPLIEQHDSVGIINLDTHSDLWEPVDGESHTGSPFYDLLQIGLDQYTQVGARPTAVGNPNIDPIIEQEEVDIIMAEEVGKDVAAATQKALETVSDVDQVYLSFDIDVLDNSTAYATSSPTPGGLLSREADEIVRTIAQERELAGFGVYEVAPMIDHEEITVKAATNTLISFLNAYANR